MVVQPLIITFEYRKTILYIYEQLQRESYQFNRARKCIHISDQLLVLEKMPKRLLANNQVPWCDSFINICIQLSQMSKTIKIEKTIKVKNVQRNTPEKLICQHYAKKLFNSNEAQFEITQTCKTISFKQNKLVCAKKIESKFITIDNNDLPKFRKNLERIHFSGLPSQGLSAIQKLTKIPGLGNLVTFESESEQQDLIFQQIIGQALDTISGHIDLWLDEWQSQLKNTKLVVHTIKFIEEKYQLARKEMDNVIQKRKAKLKQLNERKYSKQMQKMKGLLNMFQIGTEGQPFHHLDLEVDFQVKELDPSEFVDALFNQLPELSDFFDCFDPTLFTAAQLSQLKQINSQVLSQIMEVDFSRAKDKKKKRKNKNKKKKQAQMGKSIANQLNNTDSCGSCKIATDSVQQNINQDREDPRIIQICQYMENVDINLQNRTECHVTQEWLHNLQRQIRYNKILMQS